MFPSFSQNQWRYNDQNPANHHCDPDASRHHRRCLDNVAAMKNNGRKGKTSETRFCDQCVPRVCGVPMIDGIAARWKTDSRRLCNGCGQYVTGFWHKPYQVLADHPIPNDSVLYGPTKRRITGSKVG